MTSTEYVYDQSDYFRLTDCGLDYGTLLLLLNEHSTSCPHCEIRSSHERHDDKIEILLYITPQCYRAYWSTKLTYLVNTDVIKGSYQIYTLIMKKQKYLSRTQVAKKWLYELSVFLLHFIVLFASFLSLILVIVYLQYYNNPEKYSSLYWHMIRPAKDTSFLHIFFDIIDYMLINVEYKLCNLH